MKHSITIAGHKTSISLEPEFWQALQSIAEQRQLPLNALIANIDKERLQDSPPSNLSSALRVFVLRECLRECTKSN